MPYRIILNLKNILTKTLLIQRFSGFFFFDEKDPTIFIRTHNTDLKNRLTAYSRKHPAVCKLTDVDPDTDCKEFEIEKGRFSFWLTAPYREERRRAASEAAKNE